MQVVFVSFVGAISIAEKLMELAMMRFEALRNFRCVPLRSIAMFINVVALLLLLAGCLSIPSAAELRAERAEKASGEIVIGVVESEGLALQAMEMAVEELNAAGGVLGRPLHMERQDDHFSIAQGKHIAQVFAQNFDMVAVIGHNTSAVSVPAAAIYEFAGLLMLSPSATTPRLTDQGYHLIFRNIPSDTIVGSTVTEHLAEVGYQRIVILASKDDYGRGLSNAIEAHAPDVGITVVDRAAYRIGESDFGDLIADWRKLDFDAIFIAGNAAEAAYFIAQAHQAGVTQQILGSDGIISSDLWRIAGDAANGIHVISYFHPQDQRPEVQQFVSAFEQKYGEPPDVWAAQGYDAIKVLAYAIEQAGTTIPERVAEALRSLSDWPGVTGPHTFDIQGDVTSKPIIFTEARDGQFLYLESFGKK
jgi:branched-chain amino acid transport system substrate-binding protein